MNVTRITWGKSAITFLAPGEFHLSRARGEACVLKPPELVLCLEESPGRTGSRPPIPSTATNSQVCRSHVFPLVNDVVFHPYLTPTSMDVRKTRFTDERSVGE